MSPLVVEDHPDVVAPAARELAALEMKRRHLQAESVHEDDGQRRVRRTDFTNRERHPVVGRHDAAAIGL
ncbi:Uncharacterised protein [Mycobacteroides abscessus subsp. massiliense]|nr:Uncharacterised protein [Mycobacteroides abscessus subsp. massiliense]